MAARSKITPFGRFVLMLIVVVPLSFFIASYMNGEDGVESIKEFFTDKKTEVIVEETDDAYSDYSRSELVEEIEGLKEELEACRTK